MKKIVCAAAASFMMMGCVEAEAETVPNEPTLGSDHVSLHVVMEQNVSEQAECGIFYLLSSHFETGTTGPTGANKMKRFEDLSMLLRTSAIKLSGFDHVKTIQDLTYDRMSLMYENGGYAPIRKEFKTHCGRVSSRFSYLLNAQ